MKGNNRLSFAEAENLLEELLTLDNPYHCPHGRPTIISMSKADLEKKFFVRAKGEPAELKEALVEAFGQIQIVEAGMSDEFGFLTEVMTEGAYEACAAKFPQICHMIRVEA